MCGSLRSLASNALHCAIGSRRGSFPAQLQQVECAMNGADERTGAPEPAITLAFSFRRARLAVARVPTRGKEHKSRGPRLCAGRF
jgi:hypothetical protein